MSGERYELGRRRFLQATGAGVAAVASLSGATGSTAGRQVEDAPDEDEYEEILAEMDGAGTAEEPYIITDIVELQAMSGDTSGQYELGNDIDASATADWNDGAGFDPILAPRDTSESGDDTQPLARAFSGELAGDGHEISGLTVDRPDEPGAGLLFINQGAVVDLTVSDATVAGQSAGIIAASGGGGLRNLTVSGSVSGDTETGGILGTNKGAIVSCEADVDVSGTERVGGIAGRNNGNVGGTSVDGSVDGTFDVGGAFGTVSNASVVGRVDAAASVSGSTRVGGFVGDHDGRISGSTATGDVSGDEQVGGFAGETWGRLLGVTARGTVEGTENVGGLAGACYGRVRACSVHGDVTGTTNVGGVLGWGSAGSAITEVYTVGSVNGESAVGALVGLFGWEFFEQGDTAELRGGYWNTDATSRNPVGLIRRGDGSVSVAEETLSGLTADQFVGREVSTRMSAFDFEELWRATDGEMPVPRAQVPSVFNINSISTTAISVRKDETFDIELEVENTGEYSGTQTIAMVVDGERFESVEQELDPGESTTVVLSELTATELPVGTYSFRVQTRNDSVEGTIEVQNALLDGTDTPDESKTETPSDSDGDGPGFGVGSALAGAAAGVTVLARRFGRTSDE